MAKQMKVLLNFLNRPSDPANGREGDVYYNNASKAIKIFNGLDWVELATPSSIPVLYPHTHNPDGSIDTIDIANPIYFKDFNMAPSGGINELDPTFLIDGGIPSSTYEIPNAFNYAVLDGGVA